MPAALLGKIAFLSDRASLAADPNAAPLANPLVYVVNPDATGLALLTDRWPYDQAMRREQLSADQRYRAFVRDVPREYGAQPAVFYYDYLYRGEGQVTRFGAGIAYDPAWSPTAERLALVASESGNDEIWIINRDGSGARQLTRDVFGWWDKRPSWSPDGRQIVFWSNRGGRRQIWLMDADGRNQRTLSLTGFNDWDPVWIKYTDPPRYAAGE
jgi:Tol biopolymer transport system component